MVMASLVLPVSTIGVIVVGPVLPFSTVSHRSKPKMSATVPMLPNALGVKVPIVTAVVAVEVGTV